MVFEKQFPELPKATHLFGRTLAAVPSLPDMKGIKVLRTGLHLGEVKGKAAVPDHAAALCFRTDGMLSIDLSSGDAVKYMAGETLPGDIQGWVLLRYRNMVLGWGKGSDGIIKNHYPKGLRRIRLLP